jgi:hypothetical protein
MAQILFGCYRRGDAFDGEGYVAAIAAVLSLYDPELMREVTDPRTGISTTEKFRSFPPNSGELKHYYEGIIAQRERIKKLGGLPPLSPAAARLPPPSPQPGDKATVHVLECSELYHGFVEWAKTGEWLALATVGAAFGLRSTSSMAARQRRCHRCPQNKRRSPTMRKWLYEHSLSLCLFAAFAGLSVAAYECTSEWWQQFLQNMAGEPTARC